jgi:hypothetical protein
MATDSVTDTFTISINNTTKEKKNYRDKNYFKKPKREQLHGSVPLETWQHIRLYT